MRPYGARSPTDQIPLPPDTMAQCASTGAGGVYAFDYPANAQMVSFAGDCNFAVNYGSTKAAIATTISSATTNTTALNELNPTVRQIPSGSTGFSLAFESSGTVSICFWRK